MKARTLLVLLAFAATVGSAPSLADTQALDLSGTWSGPVILDTNEVDKMTLVLERTGSKYRGKITDEMGIVAAGTELFDVVQKGNKLGFAFSIVEGGASLKILVNLEITADKMKGRWEDQTNGTGGAVELTRMK